MASGGGEVDGSVGLDVDVDVGIERAIDGTTMTMMTMEGEAVGRMTTMIDGRIAAARRPSTLVAVVAPSSIECHEWRRRRTTRSKFK